MAQEGVQWPLTETYKVIDGFTVNSVDRYLWIVIVGGILAFCMAWGIGANDVANAFATSVGAGSLDLKWACVIAAVFEFLGALLLGGSVTDTVRKKIIKADVFNPVEGGVANGPELLMTGFLVALVTATTWLVIATYFSLPVSTTHSIIGSLVGVGFAFRGADAIVWISKGSGFSKLKGLVGVILSWVISPVLSGILAVIMFLIVRTLVLRRKDSYKAGLTFIPLFYGMAVAVAIFFIIFKGDKRFKIKDKLSLGASIGIAFGVGAAVAIVSVFAIVPFAKKSVDRWVEYQEKLAEDPDFAAAEAEKKSKVDGYLKKFGINVNIDEELDDDVIQMHDNVEKFDPKTERLFTWVQVFTAAFDAFAHGANDVANAIAPFASIYQLYRGNGVFSKYDVNEFEKDGSYSGGGNLTGKYEEGDDLPDGEAFCGAIEDEEYYKCTVSFPFLTAPASGAKTAPFSLYDEDGEFTGDSECYTQCQPGAANGYTNDKQSVPLWILALGGAGIVLGLAMWGYRIIVAIGVKLTKLTPSRGFSIEIGAAITVLIASSIGLPVSTTHCQVGATMGVGLVEFKSSTVNWKQFFFICVGWVFTVLLTAVTAGLLYAALIYSPQAFNEGNNLSYCPGDDLFRFNAEENAFQGIGCSGLA